MLRARGDKQACSPRKKIGWGGVGIVEDVGLKLRFTPQKVRVGQGKIADIALLSLNMQNFM